MEILPLFDSNVFIGRYEAPMPHSFWKVEDLLERMDRYGIARALVHHAYARECDAQTGNHILMEEIANQPRLVPAWVLMPHHTGDFAPPQLLSGQMARNGVKAAVMLPGASHHFYSLQEFCSGPLLDMLAACRVPLFLGLDQMGGSMEPLDGICTAHPELRLVVTGVNYRINRNLYPLLEKHPHLYVETAGYKAFNGIETICRLFGAQRLVFGTGMPVYSGSGAVGMLAWADIPAKDKEQIAYKNLEELLGGVRYDDA